MSKTNVASALILTASLCLGCKAQTVQDLSTPEALDSAPGAGAGVAVPGEDDRLVAARRIMAAARHCALITVDETGQPRARTIDPRLPDESMTVWMVTNPATRKVDQIRNNPKVTLYYFDPQKAEYVTLMGTATLHHDTDVIQDHWLSLWDEFYPDRPRGVVLIEVVPARIEVLGRGLDPHEQTWEPQGVDL